MPDLFQHLTDFCCKTREALKQVQGDLLLENF